MTVLTIIQDVCDLIGLARPTVAVTSADQQVRQLVALLREEIDELNDLEWQRPTREQTFVTTADETQDAALPGLFRSFVGGTFYNRTISQPLIGPLSPQQWQARKAWPQTGGPLLAWRERDNAFLVAPIPSAGETIAYEYITDAKALASDGTEKLDITADSDSLLMPEKLATLGIRWRWKAAKGLDYAEDMATYERRKALWLGRDGGAPVLNIGGRCRRDGPFVVGVSATLSDGGLLTEDGGNVLLEDVA